MRIPRRLPVLITALFMAAPLSAADLFKLDRRLGKEPAYQGKPRYCLLAFGPEAMTRVWLVQDGETLYVDRNGNGDLTDEGERIAAKANTRAGAEEVPGVHGFEVGEIADGSQVHKDLRVATMTIGHISSYDRGVKAFLKEHPQGRGFVVSCEVEIPGRQGAGTDGRVVQMAGPFDLRGVLQFAEGPADAPIIHFGGSWQVNLYTRHELKIGRQKEISLAIGTPGLGPGTTACVGFEDLVPKEVHPRIEDVSSRLKGALLHPGRWSSMTGGMCFSPDGARLIAGDYDTGVIQVWEVESGRELTKIDTGNRLKHYEFIVSPDWKTIYEPHVIRKGSRSRKDGKRLTRWEFEGGIRAWNRETGELLETHRQAPARGIRGLSLSPDGKSLLTTEELPGESEGGPRGGNSVFDRESGEFRPLDRGRGWPGSFSPDSRTIVFVEMDDDYFSTAIKLFDVATGAMTRSLPIPDKLTRVGSTQFSPDGKLLVTAEQVFPQKNAPKARALLRFRDLESGSEVASFSAGRAFFSPDGKTFAAHSDSPVKLLVFDAQRMTLVHSVALTENATVRPLQFSPDGKWIAVLTQVLPKGPQSEELNAEDFSQPKIHLVETATGKIRETLVGPQEMALEIRFSPDGKTLAMSGIGRILLWDIEVPFGAAATEDAK